MKEDISKGSAQYTVIHTRLANIEIIEQTPIGLVWRCICKWCCSREAVMTLCELTESREEEKTVRRTS